MAASIIPQSAPVEQTLSSVAITPTVFSRVLSRDERLGYGYNRVDQDTHFVFNHGMLTFIGVFDGNSTYGEKAAAVMRDTLLKNIVQYAVSGPGPLSDFTDVEITSLMQVLFKQAQEEIFKISVGTPSARSRDSAASIRPEGSSLACTTATLVIIERLVHSEHSECAQKYRIVTANVGDSPAYLFTPGGPQELTVSHGASNPAEIERIVATGIPRTSFAVYSTEFLMEGEEDLYISLDKFQQKFALPDGSVKPEFRVTGTRERRLGGKPFDRSALIAERNLKRDSLRAQVRVIKSKIENAQYAFIEDPKPDSQPGSIPTLEAELIDLNLQIKNCGSSEPLAVGIPTDRSGSPLGARYYYRGGTINICRNMGQFNPEISPEPSINIRYITGPCWVVVGSDGFYDSMTTEYIHTACFFGEGMTPETVGNRLFEQAHAYSKESMLRVDDITLVVARFI